MRAQGAQAGSIEQVQSHRRRPPQSRGTSSRPDTGCIRRTCQPPAEGWQRFAGAAGKNHNRLELTGCLSRPREVTRRLGTATCQGGWALWRNAACQRQLTELSGQRACGNPLGPLVNQDSAAPSGFAADKLLARSSLAPYWPSTPPPPTAALVSQIRCGPRCGIIAQGFGFSGHLFAARGARHGRRPMPVDAAPSGRDPTACACREGGGSCRRALRAAPTSEWPESVANSRRPLGRRE